MVALGVLGQRLDRAQVAEGQVQDRGACLGAVPAALPGQGNPRAGADGAPLGELLRPQVLHADRLGGQEHGERQVPAGGLPVGQRAPVALQELALHARGVAVHPGHLEPGAVRAGDVACRPREGRKLVLARQPQPQAGRLDQQAEERPQAGQVSRRGAGHGHQPFKVNVRPCSTAVITAAA